MNSASHFKLVQIFQIDFSTFLLDQKFYPCAEPDLSAKITEDMKTLKHDKKRPFSCTQFDYSCTKSAKLKIHILGRSLSLASSANSLAHKPAT